MAIASTLAIAACGETTASPSSLPGQSPSPTPATTAATPGSIAEPSPPLSSELGFSLVATHDPTDIPGFQTAGYITFGPDGNLYVPSGSEILVLDGDSQIVRRWGSPGTGLGELDFVRSPGDPTSAIGGVAFGPDGSVFVVEAGNKRIQRFSSTGQSELTWGEPGTAKGQFMEPIGIAVSPEGEVFVVDDRRDDIQVFTRDGAYLRTIGRHGVEDGELSDTGNIRIGPNAMLVNADFGNGRVQAWDPQGDTTWTLGSQGTAAGQFVEPQDVAIGLDGTLLVVDDHRVQAFDRDGRVIGAWPDQPHPDHLASIAFDGTTLWVLAPYTNTLYEILVTPTT